MKRRASTSVLIVALVAAAVLMCAPAAFAAYNTHIMYPQQNITYYTFTPTTAGDLTVTLSWSGEDGVWDSPVWPECEVDGVVQGPTQSGEPFTDLDPTGGLYEGTNPQSDVVSVSGKMINAPLYIGAVPYAGGDVDYKLELDWAPATGSPTHTEYTGKAYMTVGTIYQPASTGTWHSVLQYWPGSMNRKSGSFASDVYANWDDYIQIRDASVVDPSFTLGGMMANNWESYNMYSWLSGAAEVVTDTPIPTWQKSGDGSDWYYSGAGYYLVAPNIWTAAARFAGNAGRPAEPDVFNYWDDLSKDVYPMPGSLTWNGAIPGSNMTTGSSWYTFAYPNGGAVADDRPAYFWGTVSSAAFSHRNVSGTGDRKGLFTYKFYGTSVTWYFMKYASAGIAKVLIDGNPPATNPTVDQFSLTLVPKASVTWSGLTNAAHTITIQSNNSKNPESSGYWTTTDAFKAKSDATDTWDQVLLKENNADGATSYKWGTVNWPAPVPGGAIGTNAAGTGDRSASMAFTFSGTAIDWKYMAYANAGQARVLVDGVPVTTGLGNGVVDLYSSSLSLGTLSVSGLSSGVHTIFIYSNGTKNASSGGYWMTHDGFVVGGVNVDN